MLQCDQHIYEQVFFLQVENPYYAIVGSDGTYRIEQVPPGKYELIVWHPILGIQAKPIETGSDMVRANFEFSNSIDTSCLAIMCNSSGENEFVKSLRRDPKYAI